MERSQRVDDGGKKIGVAVDEMLARTRALTQTTDAPANQPADDDEAVTAGAAAANSSSSSNAKCIAPRVRPL